MNNTDESIFKMGKISQLGPENGFTMVLDFHFGQNNINSGLLSHKLFVHEKGIDWDPWWAPHIHVHVFFSSTPFLIDNFFQKISKKKNSKK
jgi:hypothetical protein